MKNTVFAVLMMSKLFVCIPATATDLYLKSSSKVQNTKKYLPSKNCTVPNNKLPLTITAKQCEICCGISALFKGKVIACLGHGHLYTPQLQLLMRPKRIICASNQLYYYDLYISIYGSKAIYNLDTQELVVDQAKYQLKNRQGRGKADRFTLCKKGQQRINRGSFTTCPYGNNSWQIKGSKIYCDLKQQKLKVMNAQFIIGKIPLLYIPYWQFPISGTRQSGFLTPNFNFSNFFKQKTASFALSIPYYFNIAPNFDATVIPRYIHTNVLQCGIKLRYLVKPGLGSITYDYLPNKSHNVVNKSSYLLHWQHEGLFNKHWYFNINHTQLNDCNALHNCQFPFTAPTDNYIGINYHIRYYNQQWVCRLLARKFYNLKQTDWSNSFLQPQLDITYTSASWYKNIINWRVYTQIAYLKNELKSLTYTKRLHIAPTLMIRLPFLGSRNKLNIGLLATQYNHAPRVDGDKNTPYLSHYKRIMPEISFKKSFLFKRFLSGSNYSRVSLEPTIYYLYRPYRNQNKIINSDSTPVQWEYHNLFSDRQYAGLDRIFSANQLSLGATTRLFDKSQHECMNFSLGQIYYFDQPTTGDEYWDRALSRKPYYWILKSQWLAQKNWLVQSNVQTSIPINKLPLADLQLCYYTNSHNMLQISYRYASADFLHKHHLAVPQLEKLGISQIGIHGSLLYKRRYAIVASYFYDLKYRYSVKRQIGFQYNNCCWAVAMNYEQYVRGFNNYKFDYDKKLSFNVKLLGFSKQNDDSEFTSLLNNNILPRYTPQILSHLH